MTFTRRACQTPDVHHDVFTMIVCPPGDCETCARFVGGVTDNDPEARRYLLLDRVRR